MAVGEAAGNTCAYAVNWLRTRDPRGGKNPVLTRVVSKRRGEEARMGEPESEPVRRELMTLRERAEEEPDDPEGWYRLGGALDSAGHETEAMDAYQRVFDLGIEHLAEEDRPQLFVQTGSTLRNLGRLDEARALLEKGRIEFPEFQAMAAFLALVEISAGQDRRAIDLLFDALLNRSEDDGSIRRFHRSLRWYADHLDEDRQDRPER